MRRKEIEALLVMVGREFLAWPASWRDWDLVSLGLGLEYLGTALWRYPVALLKFVELEHLKTTLRNALEGQDRMIISRKLRIKEAVDREVTETLQIIDREYRRAYGEE